MLITRVPASYLRPKRINPDYYRPEYLADEKRLLSGPNAQLGSTGKFFVGPFGSKLPSILYRDVGVPLFRVGNVGSMEVITDNMAYLDTTLHAELSASEVMSGDLLIVKASVGEKICRVPPWIKRGNITQHIIAVRPNGKADMDYVAAFLYGCYGRRQLERRSLGSIIQYLGVVDAKDVLYPAIGGKAQTYIGDKVRCAQRLREHARRLEAEFTKTMQARVPEAFGPVQTKGKHSRVRVSLLTTNLNAGAYNPERLRVRGEVQDKGGKHLASVATALTPTSDSYAPDCIYIGLDSVSSSTCELQPSTVQDEEVAGTVRVFPEGPVISRLRPYLNKVSYIGAELVGAAGSTELMCVHARAGVSPWYLYGVLKLPCTMTQLNPVATGSTHPRITRDDILDLVVPWHPDSEALGAALSAAQLAYHSARRLTAAAKYLVEALIDGKVTEPDLVQAQEALERHDRGPDRVLLVRLSTQGMDVPDAKPLFPDMDKLYELLDQNDGEGG